MTATMTAPIAATIEAPEAALEAAPVAATMTAPMTAPEAAPIAATIDAPAAAPVAATITAPEAAPEAATMNAPIAAILVEDRPARLGVAVPLRFTAAAPALDLPGHVRAGSGLALWRGWRVVVQDDVHALALVDPSSHVVHSVPLPAGPDGVRTFGDERGNKHLKNDLEACLTLPDGRLVAFGSGSTPGRQRIVVMSEELSIQVIDGSPLYGHLRARTDFSGAELNIEGAALADDRLHLFQRGNGAAREDLRAINAIGTLSLKAFVAWLDGLGPTPTLVAVREVDLGRLGGVPLGFTDAAALPDGRLAFLAGAEASPDTYSDGEVVGSCVGLVDLNRLDRLDGLAAGATVHIAPIVDDKGVPTRLKLEGLSFEGWTSEGHARFGVVADMDTPDVPSLFADLTWDFVKTCPVLTAPP